MDSTEMRAGTLRLHVGCKESDKLRGDSLVDRVRMPNWGISRRGERALRGEVYGQNYLELENRAGGVNPFEGMLWDCRLAVQSICYASNPKESQERLEAKRPQKIHPPPK